MKVVVCVKPTADGEINPFDASAYEAALRIPGAEVSLLSMAPEKDAAMLHALTRLGAGRACLLSDRDFAGADTLATAYTLAKAIEKLNAELILCGRQSMEGDTAQTGVSLSAMLGFSLIPNVMEILETKEKIVCRTRETGLMEAAYPALLTVERIHSLRLPSIRSQKGELIRWDRRAIGASKERCGLAGSPTRVAASFQNEEGKRRCRFADVKSLNRLIDAGIRKGRNESIQGSVRKQSGMKLREAWIVGEAPYEMAGTIAENIRIVPHGEDAGETLSRAAASIVDLIRKERPEVVLWGSDAWSKSVAPQAAALLQTGLCADCTALETDGERLIMYRPAFGGNVMAKIICRTNPQMATVRAGHAGNAEVICSLGKGAKGAQQYIEDYVRRKNRESGALVGGGVHWETAASRGAVDLEMLPYEKQVGMTGKKVSPLVYLAVGISGAVHHVAGIQQAGTVIAINPDPDAPIFSYADYGILARAEDVFWDAI